MKYIRALTIMLLILSLFINLPGYSGETAADEEKSSSFQEISNNNSSTNIIINTKLGAINSQKDINTSITTKELDKEKINALAVKSIKIQYEDRTDELDKVFSEEFIDKIDAASFYKSKLKPYSILSISDPVIYKNGILRGFYIRVRVNDSRGQYIQEMHLLDISGSYFIENIENDI